jgi:DNA mismatch endonuclease (patch repair protein)
MSAIKAKDTRPERAFRKALREKGHTGYRLHFKKVAGRPDIAFVGRKVAIFIHGCYWHRCPTCQLSIPRSNASFWQAKFARNVQRDKEKESLLKEAGWKVFVVWECAIKKDVNQALGPVLSWLGVEKM